MGADACAPYLSQRILQSGRAALDQATKCDVDVDTNNPGFVHRQAHHYEPIYLPTWPLSASFGSDLRKRHRHRHLAPLPATPNSLPSLSPVLVFAWFPFTCTLLQRPASAYIPSR